MKENDKPEDEAQFDTVEDGASFADQVKSLSDDQLKVVHAVVSEEAGKRTGPDLANMSEQEFEQFKRKKF